MTDKSPAYWRTSDGRKVVYLEHNFKGYYVWDVKLNDVFYAKDITPWREPATRTVWIQLWEDGRQTTSEIKMKESPRVTKLLAQIKRTITEGEFDE